MCFRIWGGDLVAIPFTNPSQIWLGLVHAYMPNLVWICLLYHLPGMKGAILGKCWHLGGSFTDQSQRWYAKFHLDRFLLSHSAANTPKFSHFWISAFCGVAYWWCTEKVKHACTTTNRPLLNGAKTVSVLQCLQGKNVCTNCIILKLVIHKSIVHKFDLTSMTEKHTNKKLNIFSPSQHWVKSEPHQTRHSDRGPRTRTCTSKTFWDLAHGFATRGAGYLGETWHPQLKLPITP